MLSAVRVSHLLLYAWHRLLAKHESGALIQMTQDNSLRCSRSSSSSRWRYIALSLWVSCAWWGSLAHAEQRRQGFVCVADNRGEDVGQQLSPSAQAPQMQTRICAGLGRMLADMGQHDAWVSPGPRGFNSVDSFFVTHGAQRFHLKILRTQTPEQKSKSQHELRFARIAAELHLAPDVWTDDADSALMLTRYVDGKNIQDADVSGQTVQAAAAAALNLLHRATQTAATGQVSGPELLANLQLFKDAIALRDGLGSVNAQLRLAQNDFISAFWQWAEHLSILLDGLKHPTSLCHLDLQAGNLFWDGRRLWLLDWGGAGFADPLSDFVDLAFNQSMDLTAFAHLLREHDFCDDDVSRGVLRLAWAHVRRYFGADLGMPWDRPEDHDVKLDYLGRTILDDMKSLHWPGGPSAAKSFDRR